MFLLLNYPWKNLRTQAVTPKKVSLENLTLRHHTNSVRLLLHLSISTPTKQSGVAINTRNGPGEFSFRRFACYQYFNCYCFWVIHKNKLRQSSCNHADKKKFKNIAVIYSKGSRPVLLVLEHFCDFSVK